MRYSFYIFFRIQSRIHQGRAPVNQTIVIENLLENLLTPVPFHFFPGPKSCPKKKVKCESPWQFPKLLQK